MLPQERKVFDHLVINSGMKAWVSYKTTINRFLTGEAEISRVHDELEALFPGDSMALHNELMLSILSHVDASVVAGAPIVDKTARSGASTVRSAPRTCDSKDEVLENLPAGESAVAIGTFLDANWGISNDPTLVMTVAAQLTRIDKQGQAAL